MPGGTVIYEAHPAMFRAHPFWFILYVLLIAAFGRATSQPHTSTGILHGF